jgi:hypothetical protein
MGLPPRGAAAIWSRYGKPRACKTPAEGVTAWNEWREQNPDAEPDLSGASCPRPTCPGRPVLGDLRGANLRRANLSGAKLSDAGLSEAYLCQAILCHAYLSGLWLCEADLSRADLTGTDLSWANLSWADRTRPTCSVHTCSRPACAGPSCAGPTCPWPTCPGPTCPGPTCTRPTCPGRPVRGQAGQGQPLECQLSYANLHDADLSNAQCREPIFERLLSGMRAWTKPTWMEPDSASPRWRFWTFARFVVGKCGSRRSLLDWIRNARFFEWKIPETFLGGAGVPPLVIEATRGCLLTAAAQGGLYPL